MFRLQIAVFTAVVLLLLPGGNNPALAEDDWQRAKREITERFERYKKEGLTAEETEKLTSALLDAAGDEIEGTGVGTLLRTLNQQSKNAVWLLDKKQTAEDLIDVVGTIYALATKEGSLSSGDLVEAYRTLGKGVKLSTKLAELIPGMNIVMVPMLNAYAEAINNGAGHVAAIADARERKNRAIASWLQEPDYGPPPVEAWDLVEEEPPTPEEIEWEKLRQEELARVEACIEICRDAYRAYNEIANTRARARDAAAATSAGLEEAVSKARRIQRNHNDRARKFNATLAGYRQRLARRDAERERLSRAEAERNTSAVAAYRQSIGKIEELLENFRKNLRTDLGRISTVQDDYLESRGELMKLRARYRAERDAYEQADNKYQVAVKAYQDCVAQCRRESEARPEVAGLWKSRYKWQEDDWVSGQTVCLHQEGARVSGTYSLDDGEKRGTIKEGSLSGNRLTYSYSSFYCEGSGHFEIAPGAATMRGPYRCEDGMGIWELTRAGRDCGAAAE